MVGYFYGKLFLLLHQNLAELDNFTDEKFTAMFINLNTYFNYSTILHLIYAHKKRKNFIPVKITGYMVYLQFLI